MIMYTIVKIKTNSKDLYNKTNDTCISVYRPITDSFVFNRYTYSYVNTNRKAFIFKYFTNDLPIRLLTSHRCYY